MTMMILVVVAHISGNHALAAKTCGIQAQIVMPQVSPTVKVLAKLTDFCPCTLRPFDDFNSSIAQY